MTTEAGHEWIDVEPRQKALAPRIVDAESVRTKRVKKTLDDEAATLDPFKPNVLARLDIAREMWGNFMRKSTILAQLMNGIPDKEVPPISSKQAYIYYHRMIQDMQDETTKSRSQKIGEARSRLIALAKSAEKAGNHGAAIQCMDRLALIDSVPNAITAPRRLDVLPEGAPPSAPAQELIELNREQLRAIVQTGRLPEPKS